MILDNTGYGHGRCLRSDTVRGIEGLNLEVVHTCPRCRRAYVVTLQLGLLAVYCYYEQLCCDGGADEADAVLTQAFITWQLSH